MVRLRWDFVTWEGNTAGYFTTGSVSGYARRVLFRLGRRAIGLVTGFFALLGFIAVPIGDRTAYEHVKLTLATPEGREATATLSRAYSAIQSRLFGWAKEKLDATNGTPGSEPPTGLDPRELVPHIGDRPHGSADSERK